MSGFARVRGHLVLMLGNVAGMVDLVALPLWISGLMLSFGLDAQQAGLQVTLYISGVFIASIVLAPRFHRIPARWVATLGFAAAGIAFLFLRTRPDSLLLTAGAHVLAGIGAGSGLSCVHGTIGRSANPSRLFALVSFGLGALGIPFFALVPALLVERGVQSLFLILGALLLCASVACAVGFPQYRPAADARQPAHSAGRDVIVLSAAARRGVIVAFLGVALMATAQAMAFSFVDRLGAWRGFTPQQVAHVLVVGGLVNLLAPIAAGLLQGHVSATRAASVALLCHALLTFTAMNSAEYLLYAVAAASFVFFTVFGHTFMFGIIAQLDPNGRASASTPAMLMIGSAIGPLAGGTIVKYLGFPTLGVCTSLLALASSLCFYMLGRSAGWRTLAPAASSDHSGALLGGRASGGTGDQKFGELPLWNQGGGAVIGLGWRMTSPTSTARWKRSVDRYRQPSVARATWQILNTFIPYGVLWYAMYQCLQVSAWLVVPLAILAAGFLVRIFIIFHDCGHGSYFRSRKANAVLGFICGALTFVPYLQWTREHARHHASSGDLDRRGIGDIWTLTVREYLQASRWRRFAYRLARNPFLLFVVAPAYMFVVHLRFASGTARRDERESVQWTNLAIALIALALSAMMGLKAYLLIQSMVMLVAASAGVWLFYVQHQFDGVYWERSDNWDYTSAALRGSSYYKLPRILQWFTGNIGFHHIHHLSPAVPNYHLERCHRADPLFGEVKPLTLLASLRSLKFRLWDEQRQRLVSYAELRAALRSAGELHR